MSRRDAAFALVEQGGYSLGTFLTGVIVARQTDQVVFGSYVLMMMVIVIVIGVQNAIQSLPMRVLTLPGTLGRQTDRYREQKVLNGLLGCCAAVVAFFAAMIVTDHDLLISLLFAMAASVSIRHEFIRADLQRHQNFKLLAITQTSLLMLKVLSVWTVLAVTNFDLMGVFSAIFGAYLVTNGIVCRRLEKNRQLSEKLRLVRVRAVARKNWRFGKWLLLESLVFVASSQIYLMLLAAVDGKASAGVLGAIQNLLNALNIAYLGLSGYALQRANVYHFRQAYAKWRRLLVMTAILFMGLGLIAVMVSTLWGDTLLALVYGTQYLEYGWLLGAFAVVYLLRGLNIVWSTAYRSAGDAVTGAKAKTVSAVLALLLAYPLIESYGIVGAAVGLFVTQLSWFAVYSRYAPRKLLWG